MMQILRGVINRGVNMGPLIFVTALHNLIESLCVYGESSFDARLD